MECCLLVVATKHTHSCFSFTLICASHFLFPLICMSCLLVGCFSFPLCAVCQNMRVVFFILIRLNVSVALLLCHCMSPFRHSSFVVSHLYMPAFFMSCCLFAVFHLPHRPYIYTSFLLIKYS